MLPKILSVLFKGSAWWLGLIICMRFAAVERPNDEFHLQLLYVLYPFGFVLFCGLVGGFFYYGQLEMSRLLKQWDKRVAAFVVGLQYGLMVGVLCVFVAGMVFGKDYCTTCSQIASGFGDHIARWFSL